ncbi:mCG145743, isoform CRA_b [Mus musculus]|nr:mCG145743, isoform CRA_b [Mus musculus]
MQEGGHERNLQNGGHADHAQLNACCCLELCGAWKLFQVWKIPTFFELCSDNMKKACSECFTAVSHTSPCGLQNPALNCVHQTPQ